MSNKKIAELSRLTPEEIYGFNFEASEESTGWVVSIISILAVVGYNPENADFDNPKGEIIQERYYVQAEDCKGNRQVWEGTKDVYETVDEAETAYLLFSPPVEFWLQARPAYGSEAYASNWRKYEAAEIRREKENEEFLKF